jgi:hypothetical protein
MSWTAYNNSVTVITLASDEVLSIEIVSLPVGGMITRIAWGRTIRRIVRPLPMPSAWAASAWPCSTDRMPALTISAMYAPSFRPSPSMAAVRGVMREFALTVSHEGPNGIPTEIFGYKNARLNQTSSWTSTGVPRKNQMYSQLDPDSSGFADSRMTASTTPSAIPIAMQTTVSRIVTPRPASTLRDRK